MENSFSFIFESSWSDFHERFRSKTGRKVLIALLQLVVQHRPYQHPIAYILLLTSCLFDLSSPLGHWLFLCTDRGKPTRQHPSPCIEIQKH